MWVYYPPKDESEQFGALLCLETGASIGIIHQGERFAFSGSFPTTRDANINQDFTSQEEAEARLRDLAVRLQAIVLTESGCPIVKANRPAPLDDAETNAFHRLRGRKQGNP